MKVGTTTGAGVSEATSLISGVAVGEGPGAVQPAIKNRRATNTTHIARLMSLASSGAL